ncbi:PAS domain S-box protein [Patescibacteria group bacterium]|nr:PAS domain S-box protein [Patescibacteria group bacterium]
MFFKKKSNRIDDLTKKSDTAITNYLTDGLLLFDTSSRIVLVNPQAERFFEIIEEKVFGKTILELSRFERVNPLVNLLGGSIKLISKKELSVKDNFIVEVTSVPIMYQGERTHTLVIVHDVTREKLSDKMKSEFVTLAAHQLRTPTSGIKWSLETLLEGELGGLNEKQKEVIKRANDTNNKVIELVRDLLDIAQIEEGRYLTNLVLFNIDKLIDSVIESRKQEIINKKIKVEFHKTETSRIMIDVEKMDIVFKNILDNALRYTSFGGKILIELRQTDKKEMEIQISDNGAGIPLDEQNRVFSKFFRGTNVMKMETEGTGLGLYIVKNIIEAHGGRIWFESKEGVGSTFSIILPIKERYGEFLSKDFY